MKKNISITIIATVFSLFLTQAQTTIPDANFEQALIDLGIDSDETINGEVSTDDISSIIDLNVYNKDISSLSGIEDFASLESLNCANNSISTINVSNNLELRDLNCSSNILGTLTVFNNINLEVLYCQNNFITNIDISANPLLKELDITSNYITEINTDANDLLVSLKVSDNLITALNIDNNTNLEDLMCSDNQIETISLNNNIYLRNFLASSNQLNGINLIENDSLRFLDISNNQLINLNVDANTFLTNLTCSNNQLTNLNLIENDSITALGVSHNQLTALDVSSNLKLGNLVATSNQITALNLVSNILINSLDVSNNLLQDLDLSNINTVICPEPDEPDVPCQSDIVSVNVSGNQLITLNISNGFNNLISRFNAENNPNLYCIEVDDPNNANMASDWLKDDIAFYNSSCVPVTYVPDDNFEQALINLGYDDNLDDYVITANVELLESLNISGSTINDVTGLENFIALQTLNCSNNSLTQLNLNTNTALTFINCSNNALDNLTLNNNTVLTTLIANNNILTSIDLNNNPLIFELNISNNQISVIELSTLINLTSFNCHSNQFIDLDLNSNVLLTDLNCSSNNLYVLNLVNGSNSNIINFDVTDNPQLTCISVDDEAYSTANWTNIDTQTSFSENCNTTLISDANFEYYLETHDVNGNIVTVDDITNLGDGIEDNNLVPTNKIEAVLNLNIADLSITNLEGIENFIALQTLDCSNNALVNLVLNSHLNLLELICNNNDLSVLNIKNGQNNILTNFNAIANANLFCIEVDNPDIANATAGWEKDMHASYSDNCSQRQTYVPDDNFEQALIDLGLDYGGLDNFVPAVNIEGLLELDVSEKNINDLTGIEDFLSLTTLNCYSNYLTTLDVSNNINLINLNCGDNHLSNLNVTSNINLQELLCDSNNLSALNVSALSNLLILDFSTNHITSNNIQFGSSIEQLFCANNNLTTIVINNLSNLEVFDCSNNYLTTLDVALNVNLLSLKCSNNYLTTLNVALNVNLIEVSCNSNQIDILDFITNILLLKLNCDNNGLSNLNVNTCVDLLTLSCASNNLDNLDINQNVNLVTLNCSSNNLGSNGINLMSNINLALLSVSNNSLASLNIGNNGSIEIIDVSNNSLATLDLTNNIEITDLNIASNQFSEINLVAIDSLVKFNNSSNLFAELDFNIHNDLISVNCSNNQLVSFKIANGNNNELDKLNVLGNPDLTCIEIDNENEIGEDWLIEVETTSYSENCHYNDTYVPDDAFELALTAYDDISNDDYVPTSNIEFLLQLDLSGQNITDLTGIEDFVALEIFDCSSNQIDSLNVSYNEALISLNFSNNLLTSNLDLSNNSALISLIGNNTGLSSLELSNNTNITILELASNQFTEIDVSNLSNLSSFTCNNNQIFSLDLSANTVLTNLNCASNQLLTLNIKNGNNADLLNINATNNIDLACIQADAESEPNGVTWTIDNTASYSENCHYFQTYVPDDAFEEALINLGYDSGELDDYVLTLPISAITNLNVSNSNITDLTGIEDFESLISLNCNSNQLVDLDLNSNILLENINCSNNQLITIDLVLFPNLISLDVSNNILSSIDVSSNSTLSELYVTDNNLTNLNLIANSNLSFLNCSFNQLTLLLDLSENSLLEFVYIQSNMLTSIDIQNGNNQNISFFNATNNPDLSCVLVNDPNADIFDNWDIDPWTLLKLICEDEDNDGVGDSDDLCPNTPIGNQVDLFGCSYFNLPTNNFTILITGETCISSNNGMINISAIETYNYTATVTGDDFNNIYNFTNAVEIRNLHSGTYQLCITIEEEPDYMNCYEFIITEPEELSVSTRVSHSDNKVSLELSGGSNYTINLNGILFNTTDSTIILNLTTGINYIEVRTGLECQGVYNKTIFISNNLLFYPNPFKDFITVFIKENDSGKIHLNIHSQLGQLVMSESLFVTEEGLITIYGGNLPSGIYFVSIKSNSSLETFKIVKK